MAFFPLFINNIFKHDSFCPVWLSDYWWWCIHIYILCIIFVICEFYIFACIYNKLLHKNTNNLSLMTEYHSTHPRRCITVTSNKFSAVCFILIIAVVFIWKTPLILVSRGCVLPIVSFPLPMSLLIKTKL